MPDSVLGLLLCRAWLLPQHSCGMTRGKRSASCCYRNQVVEQADVHEHGGGVPRDAPVGGDGVAAPSPSRNGVMEG